MTLQEIVEAAQHLSLHEQMRLINQLVQVLEQKLQSNITTAALQALVKQQESSFNSQTYSLKGQVKYYAAPYDPIAFKV